MCTIIFYECFKVERTLYVQHTKNCFARERTENATDITLKQIFHHIKKRISVVKCRFYFFDIGTTEKVIQV